MALKRRIKKLSKSEIRKVGDRHYLVCSECGTEEVEVPYDIASVVCAYCVQKMVAPPAGYKKEKSDKPRGWHFKEYFEHEGIVYSKGQEVTDPLQIEELRNKSNKSKTIAKKVQTMKTKKLSKSKTSKAKVTRGRKNARTTK